MDRLEINQLEPLNYFPNCLLMKLHSVPVQLKKQSSTFILTPTCNLSAVISNAIELKLTIRFGEQEIEGPGGTIRFGLKRGSLRLKLKNGKMPIEKMGLIARFENEIDLEIQQENGQETELNVAVASSKVKGTNKTSIKTKYKSYQCHTEGTETEPIWVFEVKTTESVLKGQINQEKLGIVEITIKPCTVEAEFEVRDQRDIYLIESEGWLRAKNLSRNKTAILARELYLWFIKPKLQPYLSRIEGQL